MKILLLLPAIALSALSHRSTTCFSSINTSDTAFINHVLDGTTGEWPDERFENDKETGIRYAVDNDKQTLFIALRVSSIRTQMEMMQQGMNLYLDPKGKKREGRGIEFPIKGENSGSSKNEQGRQQVSDMVAMRSSLALNLIFLKPFGFSDAEPKEQGLQLENSPNIAFSWDTSNVMHVEYAIPLNMLDENVSSLNQKNISIGWKINGIESTSGNTLTQTTTTTMVGRPSGPGSPVNRSTGAANNNTASNQASNDKTTNEHSFWTKHTISL